MAHYLLHNDIDELEIDQIILSSKLLQSTIAQGRHIYPDFRLLAEDVFFSLYKVYIQTCPQAASDSHQRLLVPLLHSPVLAKLRRRSASSLPNSFIALKLLLDFFLEQTRGRDYVKQTLALEQASLTALQASLTANELQLLSEILSHQSKAVTTSNLIDVIQEIYDFSQSDATSPTKPQDASTESDGDGQSLFEESLQLLQASYEDHPGDQAIQQRLDDQPQVDQTFKGGLETEMNNRLSSFLKKQILTQSNQLGEDTFISPLAGDEPVTDYRVQSNQDDSQVIATELWQLTKDQAAQLQDIKRTGHHETPPRDLRELDYLDPITNPAANIAWDLALEDVAQSLDRFDQAVDQLGIRKDSLANQSFDQVIDIYRRFTSPKFHKLLDRIGRNKRYARKIQYQKRHRLAFPIDKITTSNRIDQMIDDEYISLALDIDEFEKDFYDRYLHDSLQTTQMINRSDRRRGPIVVCYDGSGSMNGVKIQDTQTHILTILEVARIQKRRLILIQFASKAEPLFIKELNPLEISAQDVYDILDTFISGGTDFELPLKKALEYIRRDRHRKSDILFFTDGLAAISNQFKQDFGQSKERYQFKLFTVIMHSLTYEDYGDIGQISDEILTIEEKDLGQNHDASYQRIYHAI